MTRSLFWTSLVCGALVIGCGDDKPPGGEATNPTNNTNNPSADEESGAGMSETGNPTTGVNNTNPGTESGEAGESSSGGSPATSSDPGGSTFIVQGDGGPDGVECDVFAQDCPEGQKCSAYAQGGGTSWNATKCVPVTGDNQPGDECVVEGNGVSGLDDCAKGSYCWDTNAENVGYCVALCTGDPQSPSCESGFTCAVVNEGVLNLCLASCDPLSQDCAMEDDLCIPTGDGFLCVLDASGEEGQQHDPCEYANSCDPGLACMEATAATECDPNAGGCCQPFCEYNSENPDMTDHTQCTGMGQKCEPWFTEGNAPPDYVNVGICVIPA